MQSMQKCKFSNGMTAKYKADFSKHLTDPDFVLLSNIEIFGSDSILSIPFYRFYKLLIEGDRACEL